MMGGLSLADTGIELWLKVLGKYLISIIICFLLGLCASYLGTHYLLKREYQASATILFNFSVSTKSSLSDQLAVTATYIDLLKSRKVAEQVANDLHSNESPASIEDELSTSSSSSSLVATISIIDHNPDRAVALANAYADVAETYLPQLFNYAVITVIDKADESMVKKPIRPRPIANMVVGGMVGIILGLCQAFLRYRLRSIRRQNRSRNGESDSSSL